MTDDEYRAAIAKVEAQKAALIAGVARELGAVRRQTQTPVAVRGSRALGAKLGYYEMKLRDGTLGYSMRRADDCFQAAIATYLQVPPHEVPDLHLDELLVAGKDPEEITRSAWQTMLRWADQSGLIILTHTEPPTTKKRWIGIVTNSGIFGDHCLVLNRREILHNPMSFEPNTSSGYQLGDVDFGITFEKE